MDLDNQDVGPNASHTSGHDGENHSDTEKDLQEVDSLEIDDENIDQEDDDVMIVGKELDGKDSAENITNSGTPAESLNRVNDNVESPINLDSDGDVAGSESKSLTADVECIDDDDDEDEQPEASLVIDESSNDMESNMSVSTLVVEQEDHLQDSQGTQASTCTTDSSVSASQAAGFSDTTPVGKGASKRGRKRVAADSDNSPDLQEAYAFPFKHDWKREVVYRNVTSGKKGQCDIYYFAPSGKKLRSMVEIENWLKDNKKEAGPVKIHHFTFQRKAISEPPFEIVREAGKSWRHPTSSGTEATPSPKRQPLKKIVKPSLAETTLSPKRQSLKKIVTPPSLAEATLSPKRRSLKKSVKPSLAETTQSPAQNSAKRVVKKTKDFMNSLQLRSRTRGSGFGSGLSPAQRAAERKAAILSNRKDSPISNTPVRLSTKRRSFKTILSDSTPTSKKNSPTVVSVSPTPGVTISEDTTSSPQPNPVVRTGPKIKYVPLKSKPQAPKPKRPKRASPEWRPSDESSDFSSDRETSPVRNVEVIRYGVSSNDTAGGGDNEDELQNVLGTPSKLISSIVNPEPEASKAPVPHPLSMGAVTPSTTQSFNVVPGKVPQIITLRPPANFVGRPPVSSVGMRFCLYPKAQRASDGGGQVFVIGPPPPSSRAAVTSNVITLRGGMPVLQPRPHLPRTHQLLSQQSSALLPPPPPLASRPNFSAAPTVVPGSSHPSSLLPALPRILLAPPATAPSTILSAEQESTSSPPVIHPPPTTLLPKPRLQHSDSVPTTSELPPPVPVVETSNGDPTLHTSLASPLLLSSLLNSSASTLRNVETAITTSTTALPVCYASSTTTNSVNTSSVPDSADKDLVDKIFNNLPSFLNMSVNNRRRKRDPLVNNSVVNSTSLSQNVSHPSYSQSPSSSMNCVGDSKRDNSQIKSVRVDPSEDEDDSDESDDDSMLPISFGQPSASQGNDKVDTSDFDSDEDSDSENEISKSKDIPGDRDLDSISVISLCDSDSQHSDSTLRGKKTGKQSVDLSLKLERFLAFRRVQDNLPVMLNIFRSLSKYDLLRVGCVCHSWYTISRMRCLWEKVEAKSFQNHWQSAIKFFIKVGVTNLTIEELGGSVEADEIVKALGRLTQLKELQFHKIPQHIITRIMETMPHLQNVGAETIIDAEPMGDRSRFSWNTFPKELAMSKAVEAVVEKKMTVKAAANLCSVSESELRHLMEPDQSGLRKQEEDNVLLCCMRMARMGFTISISFIQQRMEEEVSKRPELCRPMVHVLKLSCFQLLERNQHLLRNTLPYNPTHSIVSKLASYSLFLQNLYNELKVTAALSVHAFVMKKFSVLNPAGNRFYNVTGLSLVSAENIPIPAMLIFPNVVHYPNTVNRLILVGSKDGLPTPNMITHYLRAVFAELKKRPLIIFFNGDEHVITDQLVTESINSSIHFHCIPPDIADIVFPGNHGGILNQIYKTSREGTLLMKEGNFVYRINEEIKMESKYMTQVKAFAKTGIYPVKAKASIDLYHLTKSDNEPTDINGDDSMEEDDEEEEGEEERDLSDDLSDEGDEPIEINNSSKSTAKKGKLVMFRDILKNKLKNKVSNKMGNIKTNNSNLRKDMPDNVDTTMDESRDSNNSNDSDNRKKRTFDSLEEDRTFDSLEEDDDKTDPDYVNRNVTAKKMKESEQGPSTKVPVNVPRPVKKPKVPPQQRNISSVESILETINEVIARSREDYEAQHKEVVARPSLAQHKEVVARPSVAQHKEVVARPSVAQHKEVVARPSVAQHKEVVARPSLKLTLLPSKGYVSVVKGAGEMGQERRGKKSTGRKGKKIESDSSELEETEEEDWESEESVEEEEKHVEAEEEEEDEESSEAEEKKDDDEEEDEEEEEDQEADEGENSEADNEQSSKESEVEEEDDDDKENKNYNKDEEVQKIRQSKEQKKKEENEVSSDVSEQEVEEICSDEEEEMDTSHQAVEADSEIEATDGKDKKKSKKKKRKKNKHHVASTQENSSLNESTDRINRHKKKKKKRKKKKKKNNGEDESISEEKTSEELATADTSLPAQGSESVPELKKDMEEVKREFIRRVSIIDHDYDAKFDSDSGTEAPTEDSVHEVKMDFGDGEWKTSGESDSAEVKEVEEGESKSGEETKEADKDETSDSSSSSSSSGSGSSSDSSSNSDNSESGSSDTDTGSDEEESSGKASGSNAKRSQKADTKEQNDSEESSEEEDEEEDSSQSEVEEEDEEEEEGASSDEEEENEDDDDEEEEEDDEKCQLCMLSNPPHSKDQVIDWVDCDGNCGRWFHVICIQRSQAKANPKHYVCPSCRCKR